MGRPLGELLLIYGVWVTIWSFLTFLVYGWDKLQAKRGGWRIPEATLHRLAFIGGWPGAWLGQAVFHHKTHKASFQRVFWLAPLSHAAALAAYYVWGE